MKQAMRKPAFIIRQGSANVIAYKSIRRTGSDLGRKDGLSESHQRFEATGPYRFYLPLIADFWGQILVRRKLA